MSLLVDRTVSFTNASPAPSVVSEPALLGRDLLETKADVLEIDAKIAAAIVHFILVFTNENLFTTRECCDVEFGLFLPLAFFALVVVCRLLLL